MAMPLLLVCIFGIFTIRKRSAVKSVRLTATLGLCLVAVLTLFSAAYNANFDIIVGSIVMRTGMPVYNFMSAVFIGVSNLITAIAIALLIAAVFLKVKFTNR